MLKITDTLWVDEKDIQLEFVRSSGPGGQNVNKVSSAVQLRFDAGRSKALPEPVRRRLKQIAGRRMTSEGVLIIEARRHRTQERNREDAINRMIALIRQAAEKPRPRRRTSPPAAARKKRMAAKRHRSEIKRRRRAVRIDAEDA